MQIQIDAHVLSKGMSEFGIKDYSRMGDMIREEKEKLRQQRLHASQGSIHLRQQQKTKRHGQINGHFVNQIHQGDNGYDST